MVNDTLLSVLIEQRDEDLRLLNIVEASPWFSAAQRKDLEDRVDNASLGIFRLSTTFLHTGVNA